MEWIFFLWRRAYRVNHAIGIAVGVSSEVSIDVVFICVIWHIGLIVTALTIPVAVVPPWILAALVLPVAVVVFGMTSPACVVGSLIAFEPVLKVFITSIGVRLIIATDFVFVAIVPIRIFAILSVVVAAGVVTIRIFIVAHRCSVFPAVNPLLKGVFSIIGSGSLTLFVMIAVVPVWILAVFIVIVAI